MLTFGNRSGQPPSEPIDPALSPGELGWRDVSISMERAATIGIYLLPVLLTLGLLPHVLLWGWAAVGDGFLTVLTPWYFIPGFLLTIIVHEGLHAAGFRLFGRVRPESLHFGIDRETYSPYAGCHQPMSARAYRMAVLLPALLLGVVPLAAGWIEGTGWLAVLGTLQLIGASGDLVAYWAIRGVGGSARVLDHPKRVGCRIIDG